MTVINHCSIILLYRGSERKKCGWLKYYKSRQFVLATYTMPSVINPVQYCLQQLTMICEPQHIIHRVVAVTVQQLRGSDVQHYSSSI